MLNCQNCRLSEAAQSVPRSALRAVGTFGTVDCDTHHLACFASRLKEADSSLDSCVLEVSKYYTGDTGNALAILGPILLIGSEAASHGGSRLLGRRSESRPRIDCNHAM
jgi:hypothetical protein